MTGSYRRRIVSWAGLLLLAVNVAGGSVLPILPPHSDTHFVADDTICTQVGMVAHNNSIPLSGHAPHQAPGLCAFCLPLMHGGIDTVSDAPLLPQPVGVYARITKLVPPANKPVSTWLFADNGARAPPFSQA